jgi:EAL domain-containing protein (putative c-di-GMP-specific phosphodiesterase class I)
MSDLNESAKVLLAVNRLGGPTEQDIDDGLKHGEFVVFYQPICAPVTRQVLGFEALLRWRRGGKDLHRPDVFITLAERTGRIGALGTYVLKSACAQLAAFRRRGMHDLFMSINLSPGQVAADPDNFVNGVLAQLRLHGIPADKLQLEITESMPWDVQGGLPGVVRALRGRGVRVVLDDFFCGHMAMEKLLFLEVDGLKISPACPVSQAGVYGRKQRCIIEATWFLCTLLEIDLVVEQVESQLQDVWLGKFAGGAVQGNFYGKPEPIYTGVE